MKTRLLVLAASALLLAACGSAPMAPTGTTGPTERSKSATRVPTPTQKPNVALKKGGGFYKDDGPADDIPDGLDDIPDAEPKWEALHKPAMKPYTVLGKQYVPNTSVQPYKVQGIASWYGKKFHGQKTSIGEPYDMFAMTAAHTTLALPSYVRVTSLQSGKSVIVRVTDRGPFHADRVIDLSYTAAYKLGLVTGGSGMVEVEAIVPDETSSTLLAQAPTTPRPTAPREEDALTRFAQRGEAEPAVQSASIPSASSPPVRGVYLQLGAFANAENAENLRNHLARELDWIVEPMRIYPGERIHRLQLGPYASRDDADRVAERIRSTLGYRPTVVIR